LEQSPDTDFKKQVAARAEGAKYEQKWGILPDVFQLWTILEGVEIYSY